MQNVKIRFAYRQGFRRIWAVLSVLWIVVIGFLSTRYSNVDYWDLGMLMLLPTAGLYLLGAALVWIIEGFARPDR